MGYVETLLTEGIANGELRPIHVPSVVQCMRGASFAIYDPEFLTHTSASVTSAVEAMVDMLMHGVALAALAENDSEQAEHTKRK